MNDKLSKQLETLISLSSKADELNLFEESDKVKNELTKIAQQMQNPSGNAYSFLDPTGIPPALYSMIANLNYKINTLETKVQQQSQPPTPQKPQEQVLQNTITPSTVNYIQNPGAVSPPIEMDGGEFNV